MTLNLPEDAGDPLLLLGANEDAESLRIELPSCASRICVLARVLRVKNTCMVFAHVPGFLACTVTGPSALLAQTASSGAARMT